MKIEKNAVAFIQYLLSSESGERLEDTYGNEPIALLVGQGNVIRGLDRALLGREAGDEFEVSVSPEDAYGVRRDDQIQRVSKKYFAHAKRLRPGMQTSLRTEQGSRLVTVVKVGGKVIDVDTNHPLAGQRLNFKVRVVKVREATKTEIAHRHAHGEGHEHR